PTNNCRRGLVCFDRAGMCPILCGLSKREFGSPPAEPYDTLEFPHRGHAMKTPVAARRRRPSLTTSLLSLLALAGLAGSGTGCSTPGYSAGERGNMIARNMGLEWQMVQDDIDHALLLRPLTTQSKWNVR